MAEPFEYEAPDSLLRRLKLGREEFCQRLLTSLILGGPYPRWNSRSQPSAEGLEYLERLWVLSFGDRPWPGLPAAFVDEMELPPRFETEKGGAPDQAVVWPGAVWLIELKTEKGSHRADQVPLYFTLGRHHHPDCGVLITYLTQPADYPFSVSNEWEAYRHLTWPDVLPLIEDIWGSSDNPHQRAVVDGLRAAVENMALKVAEWRLLIGAPLPDVGAAEVAAPASKADPFSEAMALAGEVAADQRQRALDWMAPSLDELQALRLEVRTALERTGGELRAVRPWLWRPESTGSPLTQAGEATGFELRLSYYPSLA